MPSFAFQLIKTLNCCLLLNGRTQNLGSRLNTAGQAYYKGSRSFPMILGEALSQNLQDPKLENGTLWQHMDDFLITRTSLHQCLTNTRATLNHLASYGYKVSAEKAQICQHTVRFLGFCLDLAKRSLIGNKKETIIHMRAPNTRKQLEDSWEWWATTTFVFQILDFLLNHCMKLWKDQTIAL